MAYLGALGVRSRMASIAWALNPIPSDAIGSALGPYATYSGYVYVK